MTRPTTVDPRAELINWDALNLESFPPIDEWTEDHWDDAVIGTLAHHYIERDGDARLKSSIPFEEVLAKHGFTMDDLEAGAIVDNLDPRD